MRLWNPGFRFSPQPTNLISAMNSSRPIPPASVPVSVSLSRLSSRVATVGLFLILVACASSPSTIYLERDPEKLGKRTGREDALAGLSQDYKRHMRELHPSADEDDFEDAYDDAYDDAEDEVEDHRFTPMPINPSYGGGQAYEDGYEEGQEDRSRGLSRNPYRHDEAASTARGAQAWISGYEDGWNGARR